MQGILKDLDDLIEDMRSCDSDLTRKIWPMLDGKLDWLVWRQGLQYDEDRRSMNYRYLAASLYDIRDEWYRERDLCKFVGLFDRLI